MPITLNLPPEIEAALIDQAKARGIAVDAYVESLVEQSGAKHPREDDAPAEAAQGRGASHATTDEEWVRTEIGEAVPRPHTARTAEATAESEEAYKEKFRAKIDELVRRARELDAQYPPQADPDEEEDPYTQALQEKFRRKGIPLR